MDDRREDRDEGDPFARAVDRRDTLEPIAITLVVDPSPGLLHPAAIRVEGLGRRLVASLTLTLDADEVSFAGEARTLTLPADAPAGGRMVAAAEVVAEIVPVRATIVFEPAPAAGPAGP